MASDTLCNVLSWNVRKLDNPARHQVLRDLLAENKCNIACIQESKLPTVDNLTIGTPVHGKLCCPTGSGH
jgi:exonuclease III